MRLAARAPPPPILCFGFSLCVYTYISVAFGSSHCLEAGARRGPVKGMSLMMAICSEADDDDDHWSTVGIHGNQFVTSWKRQGPFFHLATMFLKEKKKDPKKHPQ